MKAAESVSSRISTGSEFHAAGLAYKNPRSPNFVRSRGVTKREEVADRRPERDELLATFIPPSSMFLYSTAALF